MKRIAFGRLGPRGAYLARASKRETLDLEVVALSPAAAKLFVAHVLGLAGARDATVEDAGPPADPQRYHEHARVYRVHCATETAARSVGA